MSEKQKMAQSAIERAEMAQSSVQKKDKEELVPPEEGSPWKVYLKPYWLTVLINKNMLLYGLVVSFWYLAMFIGCVACVNLYSDTDRLNPCALTGTLANPEEATKVFDTPLLILAIWHIIEWIRTTVLLTIVLIGVNWTITWYILVPNTLFGLIAYAIAHMAYFSEDGKLCKETQENRAAWLLAEIIFFWSTFFLYVFPFIWTICKGKAAADRTLKKYCDEENADSDDDDDGGDAGGAADDIVLE